MGTGRFEGYDSEEGVHVESVLIVNEFGIGRNLRAWEWRFQSSLSRMHHNTRHNESSKAVGRI